MPKYNAETVSIINQKSLISIRFYKIIVKVTKLLLRSKQADCKEDIWWSFFLIKKTILEVIKHKILVVMAWLVYQKAFDSTKTSKTVTTCNMRS